ncbi:magnesium transporter [Trichoderma arundinaceum]|uniref:Magnesium transporter n=1 Tax=Trichoderma arundinaceum TaxID=490622 RepID=A0A395NNR6_TRIAR|nr:magnesium transporter [Trichoderma arundinaceum]
MSSSNRFTALGHESPASAARAASSPGPGPTSQPASQPQERPPPKKRKGHRAGRKKRSRRKSFAILHEDSHDELGESSGNGFYKVAQANLSGTSIDSEALLDHREQHPMRVRRSSTIVGPGSFQNPFSSVSGSRLRSMQTAQSGDESPSGRWDESVPLLSDSIRRPGSQAGIPSYGASDARQSRNRSRRTSSASSRARLRTAFSTKDKYDINHPPSIPGSPTFGPTDGLDLNFGDVMIRDELTMGSGDEAISDAEGAVRDRRPDLERRLAPEASGDVCFPGPGMSDIGDDEMPSRYEAQRYRTRRRRGRWPDLSVLEDWMRYEKEDRSDERRVKKITEPQLINGRLRPVRKGWYQTDEEAPYRFTYFNEEFQSTIHSQSISELVQQGSDFQGLFIPEPRILSSDEESDSEDIISQPSKPRYSAEGLEADTKPSTRQASFDTRRDGFMSPPARDGTNSSSRSASIRGENRSPDHLAPKESHTDVPKISEKPVRYGERPVWWLDILCPTEDEMKVLAKAFGIHPLTAEDVMLQEAREKVELFRHYYFVNYRTFDQDINSENFLEPVNMYVIVFREGVLSFHFSVTPHPANVRRRIRQLRDYLILSSDWISYAIIDDITDVFQPLIQNIEDEVDEIDEAILQLHTSSDKRLQDEKDSKHDDNTTIVDSSGDMLRRVGDCRKRVMSLYRLLGNKADVIKGFAKRCNERWEVAPRSEIGLYLGDIQDHIVTMTSNLSHYEKILARSHGNYLAQINIRMNERQEQTADVLGKLTVLGTIVLPMNIITGLWGMNVWVPGQEIEGDLTWFVCITAGLLFFGLACYWIAKRVYNIV